MTAADLSCEYAAVSNPTQPNELASLVRTSVAQVPPLAPCGSVDPHWAEALMRQHPRLSAAAPMVLWQRFALFAVAIVVAAGLWTSPDITAAAIMTLLCASRFCGPLQSIRR